MIQIQKENDKGYRFFVTSESGAAILQSRWFETEEQLKEIVQYITSYPIFERKTNHEGKFVIYLKNRDGDTIGESKTYTSEAGMENGIKNIRKLLSYPDRS